MADVMISSATDQAVRAALSSEVFELPPAPTAALRLLQLTRDADTAVASLARLIETEPALAAKVLRQVNSAYYGFSRRVTSIGRAVTLLGFSCIRQIALQVLFFDSLLGRRQRGRFDRMHFWQHSLLVAILSRMLGERLGHPDPDLLYAAGLLHDIGKVVLETYGRLSYSDFLSLDKGGGMPEIAREQAFFGVAHDGVGASVCRGWGLPNAICQIQAHHHGSGGLDGLGQAEAQGVAIVSLADFTAWTQGIGSAPGPGGPALDHRVAELVDLQQVSLPSILEGADRELQQVGDFYGLRFPGVQQMRANLIATAVALSSALPSPSGGSRTGPLPRELRDCLTAPHHSLEVEELVPATLHAIHRELGVTRVLLLTPVVSRRSFRVAGVWPPQTLEQLRAAGDLPATELPRPLIEALRAHRPIYLGPGASEAPLLARLASDGGAAIPVLSHRRLEGMLWLDCAANGDLDEGLLRDLLSVTHELGIALGNSRLYLEQRLRAEIDPLTRLANRNVIDTFLAAAIPRAAAGGPGLALGIADIDHFKAFNDHFGHQAGDDVLRLVADTLRGLTRPGDLLGRYGGEELLFALVDTDAQGAAAYGERLRAAIEERGRILVKRFPDHLLTVSVGVAVLGPERTSAQALISAADAALYRAKETGRNRVEMA
jgi:diguanylate cyclase (GGDEF)-like protein/putative nucleotidyltransferase with HDIG domain